MKHERASEEIQEKAALYALGTLTQHEAHAFELHLREGCSACEAEVRQYESVVGELGLSVFAATPPAYLRDLLSARLEREPQVRALTLPAPKVEKIFEDYRLAAPPSLVRVYVPWVVAASIAVFALFSYQLRRQAEQESNSLRERATAALSDSEHYRALLNQEKEKTRELEQLKSALSTPGSRLIMLAGQEPAPSASAQIYWDTQKNRWLVAANLPPPPSDKVYQLWYITAQAKVSAGLIELDAAGHAFVVIDLPPDIGQLAAAAITLEPAGGSEQPTMPIYAMGKVG